LLSVALVLSVHAQEKRISDAVRRPKPATSAVPATGTANRDSTETQTQTQAVEPSVKPGQVELKSSRVYVFVGKTGLGHEHAVVGALKSGELHLGQEKDAGKLEFDMRSFVADTPEARRYIGLKGETDRATQQKVNANMLGPQVLNVASFPTARFDNLSIKKQRDLKDGAAEYLMEGDFTLHGVARRIRFTALDEPKNGWHHLRGRFAIRQTDFGITPFTTALGAIGVADELTIFGDLWVRPETPLAETSGGAAR
jgi:polyisoprenoid-binding protein YceI